MAGFGMMRFGLNLFRRYGRKLMRSLLWTGGRRRLVLGSFLCMLLYTIVIIQWTTVDLRHAFRISSRMKRSLGDDSDNIRLQISKDDTWLEGHIKLYFTPRESVNNHFDHIFLVQSGQVCSEQDFPLLVIMCISQFDHVEERKVIRNTWGSPLYSTKRPRSAWTQATVKLFFITGIRENEKTHIRKHVAKEIITFKDVVVVDMTETYTNSSTKVIMGLEWINMFCPMTQFVLKVEESTFIHLPNLMKRLRAVDKIPNEGLHAGFVLTNTVVERQSNDGVFVSKDVYPFYRYPLYAAGHAYVISGNTVPRVISAAKHMPYIGNDDVSVTGVLRIVIGARLQHWDGFSFVAGVPPRPCEFHNDVRIAAMGTDIALTKTIWDSLSSSMTDCNWPVMVNLSQITLVKLLTDVSYKVPTPFV